VKEKPQKSASPEKAKPEPKKKAEPKKSKSPEKAPKKAAKESAIKPKPVANNVKTRHMEA
jgi:hypothetical protein